MNAMEGPTTVSALIHGATMVNSGIYIVARLFDFYSYTDALYIVANVAALSAFIGSTCRSWCWKSGGRNVAFSKPCHF